MSRFAKVMLGGVSVVVVLGLIAIGVIAFNFSDVRDNVGALLDRSVAEEADGEGGSENPDLEALANSEEEFEVSDEKTAEGLPSERQFADSLHHMTHQKVRAEEKWGHLEITDQRLEEMYAVAKESNYEYREFYMNTLEAWMEGDFTNAVEVHNIIWNERNGSVGRATGLMTPEEEMEYKIRHFD